MTRFGGGGSRRIQGLSLVLALLAGASRGETPAAQVGRNSGVTWDMPTTESTTVESSPLPLNGRDPGLAPRQRLFRLMGPLVVLGTNPRHFADPTGHAVLPYDCVSDAGCRARNDAGDIVVHWPWSAAASHSGCGRSSTNGELPAATAIPCSPSNANEIGGPLTRLPSRTLQSFLPSWLS